MKRFLFSCLAICFSINLLLPLKVEAANDTLNLSCSPDRVNEGEKVVCSVKFSSSDEIRNISADLDYTNNLTYTGSSFIYEDKINSTSGSLKNLSFI